MTINYIWLSQIYQGRDIAELEIPSFATAGFAVPSFWPFGWTGADLDDYNPKIGQVGVLPSRKQATTVFMHEFAFRESVSWATLSNQRTLRTYERRGLPIWGSSVLKFCIATLRSTIVPVCSVKMDWE